MYSIFLRAEKKIPEKHLLKYEKIIGIEPSVESAGEEIWFDFNWDEYDDYKGKDYNAYLDECYKISAEACRRLNQRSLRIFRLDDGSQMGQIVR